MKASVLSNEGKKVKEIELPSVFSSKIREDICQKYQEISKIQQPYGPNILSGKKFSASGKIRHGRRKWKTAAGRGISRVPRKVFWRRGTQFYWQAAGISSAVGGYKAHSPKVQHFLKKKKINKKEKLIAISSAISSTIIPEYVKKRYSRIENVQVPIIVSSNILKLKTKQFLETLKKILGENYGVAIKTKKKRAGKGKMRGRKYKKSAGILLVIGEDEQKKITGIDVRKVNELGISDLWPLGRLCIYTEKAVKDLEKLWKTEKEEKVK